MRILGNLLALGGLCLFVYTVFARFYGDESILGLPQIPGFQEGFTAVGVFSATACILLLAVICLIKGIEE